MTFTAIFVKPTSRTEQNTKNPQLFAPYNSFGNRLITLNPFAFQNAHSHHLFNHILKAAPLFAVHFCQCFGSAMICVTGDVSGAIIKCTLPVTFLQSIGDPEYSVPFNA